MLYKQDECCGCSACVAACPKNCITMRMDARGFLSPVVDARVCIACNACEKVCPNLAKKMLKKGNCVKAYAAICKEQDGEIRRQSSSGGLFWCFAQSVFAKGGIVVGVRMSDDGTVAYHTVIDKEEDIKDLMGSKYVQSDKRNVFRAVKQYLQNNVSVLFSGTPCEIAGLVSYLPETLHKHLYTIDLICHGVPSPTVWRKYVSEQNMSVKRVSFRDKTFGWKNFSLHIQGEGQNLKEKVGENWYMRGFLEHLYLRKSCLQCQYKGLERVADITLGDFWRVQDFLPTHDDDKGTSLVFVHSDKGKELLNFVIDTYKVDCCEVDVQAAAESNPMMLKSSEPHEKEEKFFKDLHKKTIAKNVRDCTHKNIFLRFARNAKRLLIKHIKRSR